MPIAFLCLLGKYIWHKIIRGADWVRSILNPIVRPNTHTEALTPGMATYNISDHYISLARASKVYPDLSPRITSFFSFFSCNIIPFIWSEAHYLSHLKRIGHNG